MPGGTPESIARWRRNTKRRLVEAHGSKCLDCGYAGPPFMYDFDHRVPADKSFALGSGCTYAYSIQYTESLKCDLVCANCHRFRTHKQRCTGCEYCNIPV